MTKKYSVSSILVLSLLSWAMVFSLIYMIQLYMGVPGATT